MKSGRVGRIASRLALGLSLLATATGEGARPALAQSSSVCTVVKLTLGQSAALEREAFKAQLVLTNNQADAPLSSLRVTISIKDANGVPVDALFFNKVTDLGGVTAVDGSGTMQPASQATINWLIVPSPGAGGTASGGTNYNVSAQISYVAGGVPNTNATQDAGITVYPQPLLAVEYALPFEVFGVDPFTLTGTTEPFPLGLRVTNVGAGTANNFQVTSAQPTITDNKQGLPINFQIIGAFVGSTQLNANALTIPFGNIAPGATTLAAWEMTSSYSGRFIDFSVGFTHAASLGGALTSLIQGVSTYTLIKDVLDDTPGHDQQFDLLVNTSTPRSQMEAGYQNGLEPKPDSMMESDRPGLVPVTNVPAHLVGALSGSNAVVRFAFDQSVPTNTWVHASIPFPQGGTVPLLSAIRSDGKTLNPHNAWIAKHIDKLTNTRTYFLHVLDYTGSQQADYGLAFNAATLITPPDPISNLSLNAAAPGGLTLSWNATGAAGSIGAIVGGQYAVFASTDLSATPSVAAARVIFSTATPALARQDYLFSGLTGNATYQVAVFLANAAGQFSATSNKIVAQTLANAPTAVQTVAVSSTAFSLYWSIASNSAGTPYQVLLSSVAGNPGTAQTAFVVDPASAAFSGLAPNKTYYVSSSELNSAQVATPPAVIAAVTTLALPPGATSPALISASSTTLTAQWLPNGNPPDTQYAVQLSTDPAFSVFAASSPWSAGTSYAFAGLGSYVVYYARVKARNRGAVETAYTFLGSTRTATLDSLPPRTSFVVGSPSFSSSTLFITSATPLNLAAVDDKIVVGDGVGVGVARTYYAVDSPTFTVYSGTFSLVAEGTHTITFNSVDYFGNTESTKTASVALDLTPPITTLRVNGIASSSATVTLLSSAALGLTATDNASGVAETRYALDGGSQVVYVSTFGVAIGTHSLAYYSMDRVGNIEPPHQVSLNVLPVTMTWTGAAGDGQWTTAGNWSGGLLPGASDDVVIDVNGTVNAAGAALGIHNLTLGDVGGNATPRLVIAAPASASGSVTVYKQATLEQSSLNPLNIGGNLTVKSGGALTHTANSGAPLFELLVSVTGDMTLESGATIYLAGAGFASGSGPGTGSPNGQASSCAGGGGHGGIGGWLSGCGSYIRGSAYDDFSNPTLLGSGGGLSPAGYPGGPGGGALLLNVNGTLTLDGTVDASGVGTPNGAGGAGGTINITARSLTGSGFLLANGGSAYRPTGTIYSGPGAGGMIAVKTTVSDSSSLTFSAVGGGAPDNLTVAGGAGTVYVKKPGEGRFSLAINGTTSVGQYQQSPTPISQALVVDTFTVSNAVIYSTTTPQPVTVLSSMTLSGIYNVAFATLTFPTAGLTSFSVPPGSNLSVTSISADPTWDWTVAGALTVSSLTARSLTLAGGGGVNIPNLALVGATRLTVPSGASLTSTNLSVPAVTSLNVLGSLTAPNLNLVPSTFTLGAGANATLGSLEVGGALNVPLGAALSVTTLTATGVTTAGTLNTNVLSLSGDLVVSAGANLSPVSASGQAFKWNVPGNLTVAAGATINLAGFGYAAGSGPGLGANSATYCNGGAGHAGIGGWVSGCGSWIPGAAYDDFSNPTIPGSGGLGTRWGAGGNGGGALLLTVGGTLTLNGVIDASGVGAQGGYGVAAGSGGSINITAHSLSGNGTLIANGGSGGGGGSYNSPGAGGMIAVRSIASDNSNLAFSAAGGSAYDSQTVAGGAGTVYFKKAGGSHFNLFVGGPMSVQQYGVSPTPISQPLVMDTFTVTNAVVYSTAGPQRITVFSSMTLSGVCSVTFGTLVLPAPGMSGLTVPPGCAVNVTTSLSMAISTATVGGVPELIYTAPQYSTAALVTSASSTGTVVLAGAQASGLLPVSNLYNLGPENVQFNPSATIVLAYDPITLAAQGIQPNSLAIYDYNAATGQWIQLPSTIDPAAHTVTATVSRLASIVGIFSDRRPPSLSLTPPSGSSITTTTLQLVAVYSDSFTSVSTATFGLAVDGIDVTTQAAISASSASYIATSSLAQGLHTAVAQVANLFGNRAVTTSTFFIDSIPPVTTLLIDGLPTGSTSPIILSTDTIGLMATDMGTGVYQTLYALDGTTIPAVYSSTFSLSFGTHTLAYHSVDRAGNVESYKFAAVTVLPPDNLPPRTTLIVGSPRFGSVPVYVSSAVTLALTAVDDKLVIGDGAGLGVAHTYYAIDSGSFTVYAGTFTAPAEGVHAISFYSVDVVGNTEIVHGSSVAVDATPPSVAFQVLGSSFTDAAGNLDVSTTTAFALLSADPTANGAASGVRSTQYQVNGGSFTVYGGTFSFVAPDGARLVAFQATDNVGNASLTRGVTVFLDATPPVSALAIGAPQYASSGTVYVSTLTPLALSAADPVVNGTASGVRGIFVAQSTAAFTAYAGTFTLTAPDGPKALAWYATDDVGNQEVVRSSSVVLDATAPQTSLAVVGGRQYPGPDAASFYASSATRFALLAIDPLVNGAASGVAWTKYQDNTGAFLTYVSTFGLVEGAHRLAYLSQDNVANLEILNSTTALVDAAPPVTTLSVGSPTYTASDGTVYVTPASPITFSASDPALPTGQPGSGVARVEVSIDSAAFTVYAATLTFAEGRHTVAYRSVDKVGNVEAARTLLLQSDATPPVTALAVSTSSFNGFVSAATLFSLSAVDPAVNGVASGVAFTRYRVNGGAFTTAPLAFRLMGPDGAYQVDYQSQDNVTNLEVLRSTAVFLDQTPPITTLHIGTPSYVALDGTQYVTPATPVTFTAVDTSSGSPASGVNRIEVALDGGAFSVYAAALTFAEGRHTVAYRSVDNVGNVESTKTLNLQSDATPPITAFKTGGTYYTANAPEGTRLYAPLAFTYSLPATDPIINNVASGLAFTRYRTGQVTNLASGAPAYAPGAFATYNSTFSWAEGIRRVEFQSQDNVGNLELLKSATVFVDATPPMTALTVGAPQYAAGGTLYVSTATPFTLASQDPVVQEVASGVSGIFSRLDANPFAAYTAAFTIPVPDGIRTASFYAADNVGNLETVKTSTVALDATPPQTALAVIGGRQFPGPNTVTFYASADTRFALPAVDPIVNGVASGLAWTRWQDNGGTFSAYLSTLTLTEGAHALGYQSQDNVLNLEVLRSTNVWIDATPPVTTVAIGSPTYTAADGTIYVTPATPITFAAYDPNLPTGQSGSGVNRIEVSLDGGAYAPYAAALKLAEGRHVILYRAVDNVANVEAYHALAVQSDATPPVSSLVIGQPQYQLPGVLLVSSRTPIAVAAVDPVSNNVASGVKDSWYNVNDVAPSTGAFQQYLSSFKLSGVDVNKVVQFYSRDNVLNTEIVRSSTVLLDSTPPEVSLLSPAACDSGICRVLKGKFPVLGTARDLHFANYVLDYAPGQNATTGYVLIGSGAVAVSSGTLGTWDASTLSGWQTLRLTATDLVANVTVLTVNVYVGDPAALMLLGNHATFDMPTGVAVGGDGKIYVADRDNDRVAVFTSTGGLAAVFGGRHDDHGDDDAVSTTTLRLHEPAGVAVDAASNIYVADTDHHRVLKLSPSGQVLLDLGRRKVERDDGRVKTEFARGRNPGEFDHPAGVAVDAAGDIYVADTRNSRVQIFTSTGGFASQFALPALPPPAATDDDRDHEKDDDDVRPALGRPAGIALDVAGNVYVADVPGHRALRYDPSGNLTLTIPIPGDKPGQSGRPFGVAVSSSGECLLVSDMRFAHVLKFDVTGAQNLSFGTRVRGDGDDGKPKPAGVAFRKPAGLALDAAGNLYVADRNAEKIEKFGLPNGQATMVVPPAAPGDDDTARDVVSRDDGGKVERKDKAAVAIPAQALSDDLKVSVSTPTADVAAASARGAQDKDLKTASAPVDFGPEGTRFQAPVTLTLPYSADLLAQQNGDETSLKVHYWNKDKSQWEDLDSQVDPQNHTVTAKTTHFSLYQVFATSSSAVKPLAAADPTFTYHDGYAFPNPVRGVSVVTLRIQPGLADSVEVHVYDISGRRVHSSSDFTQSILDDGNGKGSQYTFDHVWNISGVGSGVYMYVITARKAGMADIHKTGKVGVIK